MPRVPAVPASPGVNRLVDLRFAEQPVCRRHLEAALCDGAFVLPLHAVEVREEDVSEPASAQSRHAREAHSDDRRRDVIGHTVTVGRPADAPRPTGRTSAMPRVRIPPRPPDTAISR